MFIGGIYIATGVIAQAAKYAANALSKKDGLVKAEKWNH